GILQRTNDAAVDAGDRHNNRVLDRTKLTKSLSGEFFRHAYVVCVNGAKHEHQKRDNHHHDPGTVYKFGGYEDAENYEGGDGTDGIDHNGFLPVRAISNFIIDKGRASLIRRFQFCVRNGLPIDGTLGIVNVLLIPFTLFSLLLRRLRTHFEPVPYHPR